MKKAIQVSRRRWKSSPCSRQVLGAQDGKWPTFVPSSPRNCGCHPDTTLPQINQQRPNPLLRMTCPLGGEVCPCGAAGSWLAPAVNGTHTREQVWAQLSSSSWAPSASSAQGGRRDLQLDGAEQKEPKLPHRIKTRSGKQLLQDNTVTER